MPPSMICLCPVFAAAAYRLHLTPNRRRHTQYIIVAPLWHCHRRGSADMPPVNLIYSEGRPRGGV
jgi:hypothetical protein